MTNNFNMKNSGAWLAIFVGGTIAATLDFSFAMVVYGWGAIRPVAGGLLGRSAFQGGAGTWILGFILHYLIMYIIAVLYFAASRNWTFMKQHWIVCGMMLAIVEYDVMNLIVLPLSALHTVIPINRTNMLRDVVIHMFIIGLPIAYSVNRYSKPK